MSRGIAELIVSLEPEMRELIRLREEVVKLRFQQNPPTPMLAALTEGGPITLRTMNDGTWCADIRLADDVAMTSVSGCATDVDAFKASIGHIASLLAEAWRGEDDDA